MGTIFSTADLKARLDGLIDRWCARRALRPLRSILRVYPMPNGFTDEWHELWDALREVRAFNRDDLPEDELRELDACISAVGQALHRL